MCAYFAVEAAQFVPSSAVCMAGQKKCASMTRKEYLPTLRPSGEYVSFLDCLHVLERFLIFNYEHVAYHCDLLRWTVNVFVVYPRLVDPKFVWWEKVEKSCRVGSLNPYPHEVIISCVLMKATKNIRGL